MTLFDSKAFNEELCNEESQLTEHLEQFYFDLLNLVRFGQPSDLLIGVLTRVTIHFDVNELSFELSMQYKTHRGRITEETRDEP